MGKLSEVYPNIFYSTENFYDCCVATTSAEELFKTEFD